MRFVLFNYNRSTQDRSTDNSRDVVLLNISPTADTCQDSDGTV